MYGPNIAWVVKKILSPWGRSVFSLLLKGNGQEAAERYLLAEVDRRFRSGESSFAEAAECYNLLLIPQERTLLFPQVHEEGAH